MDKIIMLAVANIRKSKSQAVSLLIFVLIAVMFLNIGLVLYIDFGKFFDKRAEELHTPHAIILQSADITTDEQMAWLEQYPKVSEIEQQTVISTQGEHFMNGSRSTAAIIFANVASAQIMNPLTLIGESLPLGDNGIYIPYLMKTAGGYALGDDYEIILNGTELHFTVAGFTEEIPFGSLMYQAYRFYISDVKYSALENEHPIMRCSLTSIRMEKNEYGAQIRMDYEKEFFFSREIDNITSLYIQTESYNNYKMTRTLIPTIMSLLLVAFALILLVISLIVIRFRIINSIEEGMTNIGALKAVGYKSSQIKASLILQFGSIAITGGILGIVMSQLALPFVSHVLEAQSAMVGNPGFNVALSATALCLVLLSVLFVVFMSVKRISKLHPLIALRGGIETHSFMNNNIPLDMSRGALSFLLALKQLLQNKKQAVMIAVIVAVLTFASIAGLSIYYNVGVDTDKFMALLVGEKPDAVFVLAEGNNIEGVMKRISVRSDVRKAFVYQQPPLFIEDKISVTAIIVRDFSQLEGNMLYEGRYPKYSNEIAVGGILTEITDKKIGDFIAVTKGKEKTEFLITGIVQSTQNSGQTVLLTCDGMMDVNEDFVFNMIYAYLNEGENAKKFIENVVDDEGDIFSLTVEANETVDAQFGTYGDTFAAVAASILAITVMVVILTLYMVIKTMIIRRKREFGIQRAVGFTTWQLMNQIALNMTPIVLIGVVLGGVGGYFGFNPMFSVLTHSVGIIKANLPSPIDWTVITCIALIVLAYGVSMLVAWRIRKISAYSLISE